MVINGQITVNWKYVINRQSGDIDYVKHRLCVNMIEGIVIYLLRVELGCDAFVSNASDVVLEGAVTWINLFQTKQFHWHCIT